VLPRFEIALHARNRSSKGKTFTHDILDHCRSLALIWYLRLVFAICSSSVVNCAAVMGVIWLLVLVEQAVVTFVGNQSKIMLISVIGRIVSISVCMLHDIERRTNDTLPRTFAKAISSHDYFLVCFFFFFFFFFFFWPGCFHCPMYSDDGKDDEKEMRKAGYRAAQEHTVDINVEQYFE
jgi:hypothetical protein